MPHVLASVPHGNVHTTNTIQDKENLVVPGSQAIDKGAQVRICKFCHHLQSLHHREIRLYLVETPGLHAYFKNLV
jgi:hypothetical protein